MKFQQLTTRIWEYTHAYCIDRSSRNLRSSVGYCTIPYRASVNLDPMILPIPAQPQRPSPPKGTIDVIQPVMYLTLHLKPPGPFHSYMRTHTVPHLFDLASSCFFNKSAFASAIIFRSIFRQTSVQSIDTIGGTIPEWNDDVEWCWVRPTAQ